MNYLEKYGIMSENDYLINSVTNKNKIYSISIKNKRKRKCKNMVNEEDYVKFLNKIISCINHGDYYSAKELSQLELDKIKKGLKNKNKK